MILIYYKGKTMKKFIYVFITMSLLVALSSCVSSTAKKAAEQGKLALASSDYATALNSFKMAKDEGYDDDEIEETIAVLDGYIKAAEAVAKSDITAAETALNGLPATYTHYSVAIEIDKLRDEINTKKAASAEIENKLSSASTLLGSGDYTGATAAIYEVYNNSDATDEQRERAAELEAILNAAQTKIDDAGKSQPQVVYVPQTSSNTNVIATYYVVNCKESISLRESPTTKSTALKQIPLGQAVGYIENAGNGFYKINYDGTVGYSLAAYLTSSKPSSGNVYTSARVVNADEFITLRSSPSTKASEITKIPAGAYVTYLGVANGDFYYIEYNGLRGYGLKSYLDIT